MSWRETRLKSTPCPHCGRRNDAASDPRGNGTPSPGDLTVCIGCTGVCVFTKSMGMRKFTKEEMDALPLSEQNKLNDEIIRIRIAIVKAKNKAKA